MNRWVVTLHPFSLLYTLAHTQPQRETLNASYTHSCVPPQPLAIPSPLPPRWPIFFLLIRPSLKYVRSYSPNPVKHIHGLLVLFSRVSIFQLYQSGLSHRLHITQVHEFPIVPDGLPVSIWSLDKVEGDLRADKVRLCQAEDKSKEANRHWWRTLGNSEVSFREERV